MKRLLLPIFFMSMMTFNVNVYSQKFIYLDGLTYIKSSRELANGQISTYYKSGQPKQENNYKNGKVVSTKTYSEEGDLKVLWNYKDGLKHGVVASYYRGGQPKQIENYKNDKRQGVQKIYSEDGKLKSSMNYKEGQLDGLKETYYEYGQLKQANNYKNGKLVSIKTYSEEGDLEGLWNYKDEKMHGVVEFYYKGGQPKQILYRGVEIIHLLTQE